MQRGSHPPVSGQGAASTVPLSYWYILIIKKESAETHKHLRLAIKLSQN